MVRFFRLAARGLAAVLLLAMALPVPAASAGTGPTPPASVVSAAGYGGGWLARLVAAAGGYVPTDPSKPTTSAPDPSGTADAVLALHAAGVGRAAAGASLSWLQSHFEGYVHTGRADVPGALAKVILVARAAGADPRAFGGTGPAGNLVARLQATQRTSGRDKGLFGSQSPTYDGAYRQGLSLLALAAVGRTDAVAVRWLKNQQCADGGWLGYRKDTSVPCPTPDPATFSGPDTNSTALALQGLLAAGSRPADDALGFLASVQSDGGGWAYVASRTTPADPNSTSLVIQALLASGQDPSSGHWTRSGGAPYAALLRFQLGCTAPAADRGAFYFDVGDGSRKPNLLATVQAVPAAAGRFFPLAPSIPGSATPTVPCSAPTPSPSATPTPSPSSTPSATPTASPTAGPTPTGGPTLPDTGTGFDPRVLGGIGAALLLAGVSLLMAGRRAG